MRVESCTRTEHRPCVARRALIDKRGGGPFGRRPVSKADVSTWSLPGLQAPVYGAAVVAVVSEDGGKVELVVAVPTLICIGYMGQKLMKVWELMV